MKTIIDKNTGKVLFATLNEVDLKENEVAINSLLTENFVNPYWSFANSTFYENATSDEIAAAQTPTLTINEVVIDLVTKQVEVMTDEEKNNLLQLLSQ
jgi:hypothetical protein